MFLELTYLEQCRTQNKYYVLIFIIGSRGYIQKKPRRVTIIIFIKGHIRGLI